MKPLDIIEYILMAVTLFVAVREICLLVVQKDEDKRMTPTSEKAMTAEERARRLWAYLQADAFKGSEAEYLARHIEAAERQAYRRGVEDSAKVADEVYEQEQQTVNTSKGHLQSNALGACDAAEGIAKAIRKLPEGVQ